MENQIKLVTAPVITHELLKVGKSVTERLAALNLDKQVATEETIQTLKKLRAELNKELEEFEAQRKAVKEGVLSPYNEIEAVYKVEVSEKYTAGINTLKDKIAAFEDKLKAEKKANVEAYFAELCQSENIDFLTMESVGLKFDLSTTEKKYRETCDAFVQRVKDDLKLINTQEHRAEILVEYKKTLNASAAVTTVTARKESEKAEADRIRKEELARRKERLEAIGIEFSDVLSSYVYRDAITIHIGDLEYMTKQEFTDKLAECEAIVKKDEQPAAVSAPTVEAPKPSTASQPDTMTARIEVIGPRAALLELGQYMKSKGITYKNI